VIKDDLRRHSLTEGELKTNAFHIPRCNLRSPCARYRSSIGAMLPS
jgi:hypothetical protein